MQEHPLFVMPIKVRDYECDSQSVVNHARYFHYLEHTRHEFLLSKNISFMDWQKRGKFLMVVELRSKYKESLRAQQRIKSLLFYDKHSYASLTFRQQLVITETQDIAFEAFVKCACIVNNKPIAIKNIVTDLLS